MLLRGTVDAGVAGSTYASGSDGVVGSGSGVGSVNMTITS